MKYSRVVLMVGHENGEEFDCGCDQTFALYHLHTPEKHQWVIDHDRGFIADEEVEKLKTAVFTEEGGI